LTDVERAAARQARAYMAEVEALKRLIAEEEKLERAHKTLTAARAAGVDAPTFDLDAAKQMAATASLMSQALGVRVVPAFNEATVKAQDFEKAVAKLKDQRALDEQAEKAKRVERALSGINETLIEQAKYWIGVKDKVAEYSGVLDRLHEATKQNVMLGLTGTEARTAALQRLGITNQDVLETELSLRNARLEQANSGNAYGKMLTDIKLKTLENGDALKAVRALRAQNAITVKEYTEKLRELGIEEDRATKLLREMRQPAIDWGGTISALNLLLRRGAIDLQQYNDGLARLAASQPARSGEVRRGGEGLLGGRKIGGEEFAVSYDEEGRRAKFLDEGTSVARNLDASLGPQVDAAARASGILGDAEAATRRWRQELEALQATAQQDGLLRGLEKIRAEVTDVAGALEGALVNAFHGAEEALVSFVTTGEISIKRFVQNALADMTRLMLRQAMAGLLGGGGIASVFGTGASQAFSGLYGSAPGYAFGGEGRIGGSGGPDSKLFIARVTPGEHFRFTPPGEPPRRDQAPAPAAPPTVVVVQSEDALHRFMEQHGPTYVHTIGRRDPALRGRTTGR
jgi:hypothetical protein